MDDRRQIFDFMIDRIKDLKNETGYEEWKAFPKWFADMYYSKPKDFAFSDGSKDGKIDCFFKTDDNINVIHHVVNSKYTREYNKVAPPSFYSEILSFWRAFENKEARKSYLKHSVKKELWKPYEVLFERYDAGKAELIFLTNHRKNPGHYEQVRKLPIKVFHLDDLIQHLIDDIDNAMPRTPTLLLESINSVLSPDRRDTEVSTSIVFARLIDFINYMEADPHDLLFARNVRLDLGRTNVNKSIALTFEENPTEFVYSNNGITMLCEQHDHDLSSKALKLVNPRVVNGAQTLHSIRGVKSPSPRARIMVRIIQIPPVTEADLPIQIAKKKEIINKISVRSNQQNPIKLWNLVANDDYQLKVYRYFRRHGLFYERREKEWNSRSRELKSAGIDRGPGIKQMMQLVSSFNWSKKKLGPATARHQVARLFEKRTKKEVDEGSDPKNYDLLTQTPPEEVYQVYLANELLRAAYARLAKKRNYAANFDGYIDLSLFALLVKATQKVGVRWGKPQLKEELEHQSKKKKLYRTRWDRFARAGLEFIRVAYTSEAAAFRKREEKELSLNNYFKSPTAIAKIFKAPLPKSVLSAAADLFADDE